MKAKHKVTAVTVHLSVDTRWTQHDTASVTVWVGDNSNLFSGAGNQKCKKVSMNKKPSVQLKDSRVRKSPTCQPIGGGNNKITLAMECDAKKGRYMYVNMERAPKGKVNLCEVQAKGLLDKSKHVDLSKTCITFGLIVVAGEQTPGNPKPPSGTDIAKPEQCKTYAFPKLGGRPVCARGGFDPKLNGQGFCSFHKDKHGKPSPYNKRSGLVKTSDKRVDCYGYRDRTAWLKKIAPTNPSWVADNNPGMITEVSCCKQGENPEVDVDIVVVVMIMMLNRWMDALYPDPSVFL